MRWTSFFSMLVLFALLGCTQQQKQHVPWKMPTPQQEQQVEQLVRRANKEEQAERFVEAYNLYLEAENLHESLYLGCYTMRPALEELFRYIERSVDNNNGALLQILQSPKVSAKEKRRVLSYLNGLIMAKYPGTP